MGKHWLLALLVVAIASLVVGLAGWEVGGIGLVIFGTVFLTSVSLANLMLALPPIRRSSEVLR